MFADAVLTAYAPIAFCIGFAADYEENLKVDKGDTPHYCGTFEWIRMSQGGIVQELFGAKVLDNSECGNSRFILRLLY